MVDLVSCGAINWDINLFVEKLPRKSEEVKVNEIQWVSGGTAANVAVAAARILGQRRVAFLGALGSDDIGDKQIDILLREGVITSSVIRVDGEASGQAYITIDSEGENEIHTYFGANLSFTPEALNDPRILKLVNDAKVTVIMDPPLETCQKLAELYGKMPSKHVLWDPGVLSQRGLNALSPTLQYVNYLVLNNIEFENLLGTDDPWKIGSRLAVFNKNIKVIVKQGAMGCVLYSNQEKTVLSMSAVPLDKLRLRVVNTVGCGDAFIGAFASAKVQGLDDEEALRWGCAAGAYKATRMETRGSPTHEQFEDVLKKWVDLNPVE